MSTKDECARRLKLIVQEKGRQPINVDLTIPPSKGITLGSSVEAHIQVKEAIGLGAKHITFTNTRTGVAVSHVGGTIQVTVDDERIKGSVLIRERNIIDIGKLVKIEVTSVETVAITESDESITPPPIPPAPFGLRIPFNPARPAPEAPATEPGDTLLTAPPSVMADEDGASLEMYLFPDALDRTQWERKRALAAGAAPQDRRCPSCGQQLPRGASDEPCQPNANARTAASKGQDAPAMAKPETMPKRPVEAPVPDLRNGGSNILTMAMKLWPIALGVMILAGIAYVAVDQLAPDAKPNQQVSLDDQDTLSVDPIAPAPIKTCPSPDFVSEDQFPPSGGCYDCAEDVQALAPVDKLNGPNGTTIHVFNLSGLIAKPGTPGRCWRLPAN